MDLYIVLGVERTASAGDVKRAYRRLARRYHPDINPGDREAEAFFRRVAEAYDTLIDPERRQEYDEHGHVRPGSSGAGVEFEGFDFSVSSPRESASTFGDLFADVFTDPGASRAQETSTQGVDLHTALRLDFEGAMRGGTHEVTLTRSPDATPVAGRVRAGWSRAAVSAAPGPASRGGPVDIWCFRAGAGSAAAPAAAVSVPAGSVAPRASSRAPIRSP